MSKRDVRKKIIFKLNNEIQIKHNPQVQQFLTDIELHVWESISSTHTDMRLPLSDCEAYEKLKNLTGCSKIEALKYMAQRIKAISRVTDFTSYKDGSKKILYDINCSLLHSFMRTRIDFPENFSFWKLFKAIYYYGDTPPVRISLDFSPFSEFVTYIEKYIKKYGLQKSLSDDIQMILDIPTIAPYLDPDYFGDITSYTKRIKKSVNTLARLLKSNEPDNIIDNDILLLLKDTLFTIDIEKMSGERQKQWYAFLQHCSSARSSIPSEKFLQHSHSLIDGIKAQVFKKQINYWLVCLNDKNALKQVLLEHYVNDKYSKEKLFHILKGLLWSMSRFYDRRSLQNMSRLAEKCFQAIPGQGPMAESVGNAVIYTLAQSRGGHGIHHLTHLKLTIRQHSTQKMIQKYLIGIAENRAISIDQLEEITVPEFGLTAGKRVESFADHDLELSLTDIGQTSLYWLQADNKVQKTVPSVIKKKANLQAKLKEIRHVEKQIRQSSIVQRDRIERLFCKKIIWKLPDFKQYYLNHGLLSFISRRLIWCLDQQTALFINEQWLDENGQPVLADKNCHVSLWHPMDSDADHVLAWRARLKKMEIKQPFKQAYREIYQLPDTLADEAYYSYQMTSHIVKQHQFKTLAALRGWKYSLLGSYDNGRKEDVAEKSFPEWGVIAQLKMLEYDETDDFNEVGIWHYVKTDWFQFCTENEQPIALSEIEPLIFSETMRDIDLFTSVASIGNDPMEHDMPLSFHKYWHRYTTGDLSKTAQTRKAIIENLLPRLNISHLVTIKGRFLIVQGKTNQYKVHIGSGHIFILPDERFLSLAIHDCKKNKSKPVFLPFEDDPMISLIMTKVSFLIKNTHIESKKM